MGKWLRFESDNPILTALERYSSSGNSLYLAEEPHVDSLPNQSHWFETLVSELERNICGPNLGWAKRGADGHSVEFSEYIQQQQSTQSESFLQKVQRLQNTVARANLDELELSSEIIVFRGNWIPRGDEVLYLFACSTLDRSFIDAFGRANDAVKSLKGGVKRRFNSMEEWMSRLADLDPLFGFKTGYVDSDRPNSAPNWRILYESFRNNLNSEEENISLFKAGQYPAEFLHKSYSGQSKTYAYRTAFIPSLSKLLALAGVKHPDDEVRDLFMHFGRDINVPLFRNKMAKLNIYDFISPRLLWCELLRITTLLNLSS